MQCKEKAQHQSGDWPTSYDVGTDYAERGVTGVTNAMPQNPRCKRGLAGHGLFSVTLSSFHDYSKISHISFLSSQRLTLTYRVA